MFTVKISDVQLFYNFRIKILINYLSKEKGGVLPAKQIKSVSKSA